MTTRYQRVQQLLTGIKNARFGEIVKYNEELIESGDWQDYRTPIGTHFEFLRCEYDYFLAAMEADATTIRLAYVHEANNKQRVRLADITGAGKKPSEKDRRPHHVVAGHYASDPSGAGGRIREWGSARTAVVTDNLRRVATKGIRTRQALISGRLSSARPNRSAWTVSWTSGTAADAIAAKLLKDPDLAHGVWKILHGARQSVRDHDQKRRSGP